MNLSLLKLEAYRWFAKREPLITAAKNRPEMQTRLRWLSEGSLHYHLSQFQGDCRCPVEVALFHEFVASCPPMKRR